MEPSESTKKVQSEINYINNMQNSTNQVVVVSKGVQKSELPCFLDSKEWYMFPKKFDATKDADFRAIVDRLVQN